MSSYSEKLKDPRWQKKRLGVLERDQWRCQSCGATEKTLHVHHFIYPQGCEPWDVSDSILATLCVDCHEVEPEAQKNEVLMLLQFLADCGIHTATDLMHLREMIEQDVFASFNSDAAAPSQEEMSRFVAEAFGRFLNFKRECGDDWFGK